MIVQKSITLTTPGRGIIDITPQSKHSLSLSTITTGLLNVFLHHTSASLILSENFDPLVKIDLESFMQRLVKDGDALFRHTEEGKDDMPSHIRSILTQNSISIPISQGKLNLGKWQGLFLWEHRIKPHVRTITFSLYGE